MLGKTLVFGPLTIRFNWVVALFVFAAMTGLIRLGIWQLDRAREKIALHEDLVAMGEQAPSSLEHVPLAGREYDALQLQNRQVTLRGHYLNERSIFLIYQTYEEQLGFEVVTPFEVEGRNEIVLVSRGWTGANSYESLRDNLPAIDGEQDVLAQIYVPRAAEAERSSGIEARASKTVRWPLLIRHLNVSELQSLFSSPLFPYVLRLNEGQPGVLVRHWPAVNVDTGRNFSYAMQWFAMAIALGAVALFLSSNLLQLFGSNTSRASS